MYPLLIFPISTSQVSVARRSVETSNVHARFARAFDERLSDIDIELSIFNIFLKKNRT